MKIHVRIDTPEMKVDEVATGKDADDLLGQLKSRVAREMGGLKGMAIRAMPDHLFMQETIRQYNQRMGQSLPVPKTADEFIQTAASTGFVEILEP